MSFSHHLSVGLPGFVVFFDELDEIGSHNRRRECWLWVEREGEWRGRFVGWIVFDKATSVVAIVSRRVKITTTTNGQKQQ